LSVFNGSVQIFPEIFHFMVTIFSFFVFCAFVSGLNAFVLKAFFYC